MLEKELNIFNKVKADLMIKNPNGGFVVIKDEDILGVWESRMDALKSGIEKYGDVPFLVKDINYFNTSIYFTRNIFEPTNASFSK